jgi:hypothetical protein
MTRMSPTPIVRIDGTVDHGLEYTRLSHRTSAYVGQGMFTGSRHARRGAVVRESGIEIVNPACESMFARNAVSRTRRQIMSANVATLPGLIDSSRPFDDDRCTSDTLGTVRDDGGLAVSRARQTNGRADAGGSEHPYALRDELDSAWEDSGAQSRELSAAHADWMSRKNR